MVKRIITILTVLAYTQVNAQESFPGYKYILRTQGTFATGYNTAFHSINYFLHGDLEYYFHEKVSVRSDIFYFLNSKTPNDPVEPFKSQHSLATGIQYHFLPGRFDVYAGLQPGLVYGQRRYVQIDSIQGTPNPLESPQKTIAAIFSVNAGLNYYANSFFHLFIQLRYNAGWFSDNYSTASLSELRASFGLGFYIRVKKISEPTR